MLPFVATILYRDTPFMKMNTTHFHNWIFKKINEFETRTIYELNNVNIFCSFDLITTTISEMEGPTLKYKYNSFLKMISKNENRDKINIWLKELIKTLKMEPFILLPTSMNNKLKCK